MATFFDVVEWSVFLLLFFRSLGICAFAFVSVNASLFVRASIQVRSGSEGAPVTTRNCSAGADSDDRVVASEHPRNVSRQPKAAQTPSDQRAFDADKFPTTPKQQQKPSQASLMRVYEEIMASDAETIRVQQANILSQQEIIRSQRDMMMKLQQLVEEQDLWIEEHFGGTE